MDFLPIIRMFSYLLIIFLSLGLVRRHYSFVLIGNIIVSTFLLFNAITYVMGMLDDPPFQWGLTLVVILWAILHFLELVKKPHTER